jgi:hypothetical protein
MLQREVGVEVGEWENLHKAHLAFGHEEMAPRRLCSGFQKAPLHQKKVRVFFLSLEALWLLKCKLLKKANATP